MSLKKRGKILLGVMILALVVSFFLLPSQKDKPSDPKQDQEGQVADGLVSLPQSPNGQLPEIKEDLSMSLMEDYGAPDKTGLDDLFKTEELLQSYFALIKGDDPLPLGENSETTRALMGQNPYRIRFLSPDSPWINKKGELTDRWGTALYFHGVEVEQVGIRSAGPDKILWTSDDFTDGENSEPAPSNLINPTIRR